MPDMTPQVAREIEADDEINLIDLIYPIFKHRKFLIIFSLVVVALTGLYTWRMPKVYESTAISLPEVKKGGGDLRAAFLDKFGVAGLGDSGETSLQVSQSILKSEELAHQAVRRSGYYFMMGMSSGRERNLVKKVAKSVILETSNNDPTLSLSVQASDPFLAADLANTYLVELDIYNRNSDVTSAQRLRKYVEERLQTVNTELEQAQQELRTFQERNNAVSISDQARATIEVLSDMEAKRIAFGVEKEAAEKFYKGSSVELERLDAQIAALQKNIDRLTFSNEDKISVGSKEGKVEFYVPLTRIPSLNFDESRLLLNVKAKTGVVTMLTNQMEQAKLDETKDMPTVNVLDWAKPNATPVKPNLMLNLLFGAFGGAVIGIIFIFVLEYFRRIQQDLEMLPKLQEMKEGLVPTFLRRKRRKNPT